MIAVGHTIAGAASGETAEYRGAEGFTISGKRTEEYRICICRADDCQRTNMICYSYDHEIGGHPISFFMGFFHCSSFHNKEVRRSLIWNSEN